MIKLIIKNKNSSIICIISVLKTQEYYFIINVITRPHDADNPDQISVNFSLSKIYLNLLLFDVILITKRLQFFLVRQLKS